MVLDDYLRPITSVVVKGTKATMDGDTCIVQEEFSEEFLHTVMYTHILPNTSEAVTGSMTTMEGTTCTIQEDFPIVVPPPLNTVEECDQTPPSLFSPE
jgi:hypothetical protein